MNNKLFILFFILFTPIAFAEVDVTRDMPSSAVINQNFNVVINAIVSEQNPPTAYLIVENYPADIEVVDCGDCSVQEPDNRIIKWLVYNLDGAAPSKTITYTLKATSLGTKVLNGGVTENEQTKAIPGDVMILITQNSCAVNWSCSNFGQCVNGTQTRTCTDTSNCGTTQGKPSEVQECTVPVTCTPSWSCASWSQCDGGSQTRICTDANNCGTDVDKPAETQDCSSGSSGGGGGGSGGGGSSTPTCIPSWTCSDWTPTKCPSSEIQTRTCIDANNCNVLTNKPSESKECDYIEDVKPIEQPKNETKEEVINETKTDEKTPTGSTLTRIVSSNLNNLIIVLVVVCVIGASAFLLKRSKKTNVTAYSYKPTNFYKIAF